MRYRPFGLHEGTAYSSAKFVMLRLTESKKKKAKAS
jgi:hypothetical protein